MTENDFWAYLTSYVLIGIGVLLVVAFVAMVVYLIYYHVRNATSPVSRVPAKVIRKRHFSKDVNVDLSVGGGMIENAVATSSREAWEAHSKQLRKPSEYEFELAQWAECFITFSFGDREVEFRVPTQLYIDSPEGTQGLLIYQGEQFKHFIPGVARNQN